MERHGDIAATAAAEWYETVRRKDTGQARYEAVLADCFPSQAVQDSIRWKAGVLWDDPEQMARFLMNATDRWVKYSGRATIMQNVSRDHARYAIVPQGKACAYCTMIASRGFDYHRLETAKAAMHDHCGCQPCPQWDAKTCYISGYDPDAMHSRYLKAWKTVNGKNKPAYLDADDTEQSQILTVMRRQHPSEYTDGEHGYSPDRKKRSKQSVGDLNLATWDDYRSSLAERFIAANNPEWKLPPEYPTEVPRWWCDDPGLPELTVKHLNHLLYGSGERTGTARQDSPDWRYSGGHMRGYGWIADGTEFPENWSCDDILRSINQVIIQGNRSSRGIYSCAIGNREMKVAVNPRGKILSAYLVRRQDGKQA